LDIFAIEKGQVAQVPADRQLTAVKEVVVTDIKASSTLAQTGRYSYDVKNLIDERRGTAWCEGAKGNGVGDWIEMKLDVKKPDARCGLHLLGAHTCYGSSKTACKNNGAVTEVGVGRCGSSKVDATLDLEAEESELPVALCERELDDSLWGFPKGDVGWLCRRPLQSRCVRFTITRVRPGAKFADTCMSTLVPYRLWCDMAH
jgi:hypothetical protein